MTMPFSEQVVSYRPFLVKEEKILLMAKDSDDTDNIINTISDIVRDCTDGAVDPDTSSMIDAQYAYLQIRGKSIGEAIEYYLVCGKCSFKTPTTTNVNDFQLQRQIGHSNVVVLDASMKLTMKYPTLHHFRKLFSTNDDSLIYDVIAECIESMTTDEEVTIIDKNNRIEIRAFLENLLPDQFKRIEQFFTTMPILQFSKEYVCSKCNEPNTVNINGIKNFFV